MLKWIKYIMSAFLLFVVYTVTGQDLHIENQLDKYEYLCGQCMDVKSKAASGETVSRNMAKSLIESFLAYNKILKNQEDEMTAAQRHRFAQIGRWFSTGVRPETFTAVPPVHAGVPYAPVAMLQSASCGIRPVSDTVFCDNSTCRSDLDRVAYMQGGKPRGDIFILASIAAPDMAYGLMAGYQHRRWGGYFALRTNFTSCNTSYLCASDGSFGKGSQIWPTGNQKRSNLMVSGGVLAGAAKWLTVYAGAGYGSRKLAWEDVGGQWALVSDWSHTGFAAECGIIASWRYLALSAGISTISFRTAAFTCGVGVRF